MRVIFTIQSDYLLVELQPVVFVTNIEAKCLP